jgi:hypothetical protein
MHRAICLPFSHVSARHYGEPLNRLSKYLSTIALVVHERYNIDEARARERHPVLKAKLFGLCLLIGTATFALAQNNEQGQFRAVLNGYNQVPSVLSTGSGQVTLAVSSDEKSLNITLNFTKLVGVAQSAGIYLGLPNTTGGLIAPICGTPKPACPTAADGTMTITLAAADVVAIASQGLAAGDLASVIQAIANGAVYVNVLTSKFTNGEIRGQLERGFAFGPIVVGVGRND